MTITSLSSGTLNSGDQATLEFRVNNANSGDDAQTSFNIRVTTNIGELRCEGSCDFTDTIEAGSSKSYSVRLIAGTLGTNQNRNGRVEIRAEVGGENGTAQRDVSVRGPQEAPRVKEVAGKVTDVSTGDPIEGAVVAMSDSQGNNFETTTNSSGNYRFTSTNDRPIAPGDLRIGAVADGYDISDAKRVSAAAGQSITVDRITLKSNVEPTPSESPTPTPEATTEPTASATPGDAASAPPVDTQNLANESSGGGMGSWLLILMGGLLVALGVGAIVLLLVRRKDNDADDPDPADDGPASGGASVPGSRGVYHDSDDATRVAMPPMPDGPLTDATMVTRPPSLSDAPTMLHNMAPIKDEFPDPYGAPPPPGPNAPVGPDPRYGGDQRPGWGGPPTQPTYGAAGAAGATSVYGAVPGSDGPGAGGYGGSAAGSARPGAYGGSAAPGSYGTAPSSGPPGSYGTAPSSGPPGSYGAAPSSGPPSSYSYGNTTVPGQYGAPSGRPPADDPGSYRGGHGYGPDAGTSGYPAGGYGSAEPAGSGYGSDRYDEPTGRYEPDNYGRSGSPYDSAGYGSPESTRSDAPPPRGPQPPQPGYRDADPPYGTTPGGYGGSAGYGGGYPDSGQQPSGGYPGSGYGSDRGGEYGSAADQGYGAAYGGAGGYSPPAGTGYDQGGYDQGAGYRSPGGAGHDEQRLPEQRGGYDQQYGQQPFDQQPYGGQPPVDPAARRDSPPGRGGERRSLDWLDD
ncbi:carboxypeptidase regulatory-like domain-containing protein [Solwaraspora sp. WMMD791]|uniref:carboxypeptidase-like regulatory domain-containing protein n=1 Tax=Solwaraspora sp. WMMD791 TaxID=3016086 RepID=UPI002499B8FD|nr:carboxypeptidase regulatory-like domain-containing protein [Solwaraspora sp. WMMD791]WFE25871.1 carboxypeptidase regulatory-like domain-containing protein [Solwaraspora sp. WMMD791]